MSKPRLGLWDYVKSAFNVRTQVKGLGGVPVNWLALVGVGVLGVVLGPGALAVGAGLELGFLTLMSHNRRFRKVVDGNALLAQNRKWNDKLRERAARLQPEHRLRLEALEDRTTRISELAERYDDTTTDPVHQLRLGSLNRLLWIYLRLLQSKELVTSQIHSTARKEVELEIRELQKRKAGLDDDEDPAVVRSIEGTLDILGRRLETLKRGEDRIEYIDAELRRIEQQAELIVEEAALSRNSEHLSERIDAVTSTLDDTTAWMQANVAFLEDAEEALGSPPAPVSTPDIKV